MCYPFQNCWRYFQKVKPVGCTHQLFDEQFDGGLRNHIQEKVFCPIHEENLHIFLTQNVSRSKLTKFSGSDRYPVSGNTVAHPLFLSIIVATVLENCNCYFLIVQLFVMADFSTTVYSAENQVIIHSRYSYLSYSLRREQVLRYDVTLKRKPVIRCGSDCPCDQPHDVIRPFFYDVFTCSHFTCYIF